MIGANVSMKNEFQWQNLLCRKHKRRDEVTEQHVSLLLNCGLLTRHTTQKDTYWFALAGIGPLIKSLIKGRKVRSYSCLLFCKAKQYYGVHCVKCNSGVLHVCCRSWCFDNLVMLL